MTYCSKDFQRNVKQQIGSFFQSIHTETKENFSRCSKSCPRSFPNANPKFPWKRNLQIESSRIGETSAPINYTFLQSNRMYQRRQLVPESSHLTPKSSNQGKCDGAYLRMVCSSAVETFAETFIAMAIRTKHQQGCAAAAATNERRKQARRDKETTILSKSKEQSDGARRNPIHSHATRIDVQVQNRRARKWATVAVGASVARTNFQPFFC